MHKTFLSDSSDINGVHTKSASEEINMRRERQAFQLSGRSWNLFV